MSFYRNSEGYYDPTAGEALVDVAREQKKVHDRELMDVCRMVLRRKHSDEIAAVLGRSPEHVRNLVIELNVMFERKCREVLKSC